MNDRLVGLWFYLLNIRGSHWANYATTLGATIHELGHCFDLAHTPHGIMSRGHDDMNYFFIPGIVLVVTCDRCNVKSKKSPIYPFENLTIIRLQTPLRIIHF